MIYVALNKILAFIIVGGIAIGFAGNMLSHGSTQQSSSLNGKISFLNSVGQRAPDFSLEGLDGRTVKLSDYRGKDIVLFFNEGSMCYPSCWNQMAAFVDDKRFSNGVEAFSIVVDTRSEWQGIVGKIPKLGEAKILFDTAKTASTAYDVLQLQSSMHKGMLPGHTYFIIDKEGIIRYTLDDPQMALRNDLLAEKVASMG